MFGGVTAPPKTMCILSVGWAAAAAVGWAAAAGGVVGAAVGVGAADVQAASSSASGISKLNRSFLIRASLLPLGSQLKHEGIISVPYGPHLVCRPESHLRPRDPIVHRG